MPVELATRLLTADRAAIVAAARVLGEGGLVAFPTETVYGLGADATNGAAVARLYAAKGRPRFNPLIAHVAELDAALSLARFSGDAKRLADAVLAGAADPGAAESRWLSGVGACHRRARQHRGARAGSSGRARSASRRSASRWSRRRRTAPAMCRQRSPSMCAPISTAASISFSTAARPASASSPPSCRASARRRCCAPAVCRARRSSACSAMRSPIAEPACRTKRRSRPACWRRTTRRRRRCG